MPRCPHQRSTCASDRKASIVAQVKPMSSHQCAAGTALFTFPVFYVFANPIFDGATQAAKSLFGG